MKAAVAVTRQIGPEAFQDLQAQLASRVTWQAEAGILFATGDIAPFIPQMIEEVRSRAGMFLIGGSAGWVVSSGDRGLAEDLPTLGMLVLGGGLYAFGGRMASSVEGMPDWESDVPVIALADPRADLRVLQQIMTQGCIAGGGIAGFEGDRFLASNGELGEGGCSLLRLPNDSLRVGTASGLTPSGPTFTVTEVRGRSILALDGGPPIQKMMDHFKSIGSLDQEDTISSGLFLCDLGWGQRLTGRMILSMDQRTGALNLDQEVSKGSRIAFATRDMIGAQRAMTGMLEGLKAELGGRAPVAGVLFSSFQRSDLFLERGFEMAEIDRAFPGLPVLGMSTTFEMVHLSLQFHSAVFALLLGT